MRVRGMLLKLTIKRAKPFLPRHSGGNKWQKEYFAAVLAAVLCFATLTACSAEMPQDNRETTVQTTVAPIRRDNYSDDNSTFKLCYSQADSLTRLRRLRRTIRYCTLVFEGLSALIELQGDA
jgi:hypothetical protein